MIGYPYTYGDFDDHKTFTSKIVFTEISEYFSDKETQENFRKGYRVGLIAFSVVSLFAFSSTAAFAEGENLNNNNNGANSCPETGSGAASPNPPSPTKSNAVANMPSGDRGAYVGSALGICAAAMKSGAWYIGFLCAGAVIIGMRIANANQ